MHPVGPQEEVHMGVWHVPRPAPALETDARSCGPSTTAAGGIRVAVLIPCYNEEACIGQVVRGFRAALPEARIYVYDNNSTDRTVARAGEAGATVRRETRQGKGNVVRRMFADVEADVYVLVDGDDTYDAASAPALVERLLAGQLDMVNAARVSTAEDAYRRGHRTGNRLLSGLVARAFGDHFADVLSGYRVFSRRFVKSFPALASGFEIETELTVHALALRMPTAEVPTPYKGRPVGSASKLSTFRDGWRILVNILVLYKEERPLGFFALLGALFGAAALLLAWPVLVTWLESGLVPRVPSVVLATGLVLIAWLSLACGLILDTVTRARREMKRMRYLRVPLIELPPNPGSGNRPHR
jgi:glycosyltransferase involved in cell wall biosynthesis